MHASTEMQQRMLGFCRIDLHEKIRHFHAVSKAEVTDMALALPADDGLDLARVLLESVVTPPGLERDINEGIRRLEELLSGKVAGLSKEEFWVGIE